MAGPNAACITWMQAHESNERIEDVLLRCFLRHVHGCPPDAGTCARLLASYLQVGPRQL